MSVSPPGRRKNRTNLLRRPSFSPLSRTRDDDDTEKQPKKLLQKRRPGFTSLGLVRTSDQTGNVLVEGVEKDFSPDSPQGGKPSLLRRGRPASLFGSLKSFRTGDDETPPGTATSSKAPSLNWRDFGSQPEDTGIGRNRNVLHHGEAQTNTGLFWKKREYVVLTETHLIRFKNRGKATETFPCITANARNAAALRHTAPPSAGSRQDSNSAASETSGDIASNIPLQKIVAVYLSDDPRHTPTVEVAYLDSEAGQGSTLTMQLNDREDIDLWMRSLRRAADRARLMDMDPITPKLSEYAARVVEREQDYDIANFRIYKVVKRGSATRTINRSSADDFSKVAGTVCFLAIGLRSVHLIMLPKSPFRVSSPSLTELNDGGSFGIMSLTSIVVNDSDDKFSITFRSPFQKPHNFQLASLAATEIALRIRQVENYLRPGWSQRPYHFQLPPHFDDDSFLDQPQEDKLDPFDRTMIAYCTAYGLNPANIRYGIFEEGIDDGPRFELFEPQGGTRGYSALELLAVIRSLRFNESYGTLMFSGISLDILNGAHDIYGAEHVCTQSLHGLPVTLPLEEQSRACLLVQEVRALAIASRKLRRLDFSYCIFNPKSRVDYDGRAAPGSCGIVEALFPLCKQQATNVDWIALNGIELQDTDLDYLVSIAAEKAAHFRAIETSKCGLDDRGMGLLLDVFSAHENTLEALDISNNPLRLVPNILSSQLKGFGYMRLLDMSNLVVASGTNEPLLPLEILTQWRLEELRLRGIPLLRPSVTALCSYLAHPQSQTMRELVLSNCSLTGGDVGMMMQSMTQEIGTTRWLHLDVSENCLQERLDTMASAVAQDLAPSNLSMRSIEYDLDDMFENLLLGFACNKTVRVLDLSMASLPSEAGEGVCKALEKLLAENSTLENIDISGENSRLEVSKLGVGINQALTGLKYNTKLEIVRVQHQKLGLQGASTLADVLKENKQLRQLHCDCNAISLSGFTDLVNALASNYTLLYLPALEEGRDAALRQTEEQIKIARIKEVTSTMSSTNSKISSMRKTLATFGSGSTGAASNGRVAAVPEWTEQDIQAALRLVSEGWEGQKARLNAYLERNWRIYKGLPLDEDLEEADQRPGTAGSLSRILHRVALESTPTVEKEIQLGDKRASADGHFDEKQAEAGMLANVEDDYSQYMKENVFNLEQPPSGKIVRGKHVARGRRGTNSTDGTAH